MMSTATKTNSDVMSNLSNLLPTGTYLAFQTLAPLFTNNGECASVERIMTGLLIAIFFVICGLLNFTDSITTLSGKHYYGLVTTKGLYSPQFKGSGLPGVDGMFYNDSTDRYLINKFDFINGALNILTFGALSLLTAPITTCYYPSIPNTIVKCVPILIGLTVGMYFAFAPDARQGVGFAIITHNVGLVPEGQSTGMTTMKTAKKLGAKAFLLARGDNKDSGGGDLPLHMKNVQANPIFEPTPTPPLTPASTPLHRSPNRSNSIFVSQGSPNRASALDRGVSSQVSSPIHHASQTSSPIHRASQASSPIHRV